MTTVHPQRYIVVAAAPPDSNTVPRKTLKGLGAAEVAVGMYCMLMSAVLLGHTSWYSPSFPCVITSVSYNYDYSFTTGEGIWCGFWILVAGSLGIAAGKKKSSKCLIFTHMSFCIFGSMMSAVLFGMSCAFAVGATRGNTFFIGIMSTICIAAFSSIILQIVSACYCCCCNKENDCCSCCEEAEIEGPQRVMYVSNQPYSDNHNTQHVQTTTQHQATAMYLSAIPQSNMTHQPMLISQQHRPASTVLEASVEPGTSYQPIIPQPFILTQDLTHADINQAAALYTTPVIADSIQPPHQRSSSPSPETKDPPAYSKT